MKISQIDLKAMEMNREISEANGKLKEYLLQEEKIKKELESPTPFMSMEAFDAKISKKSELAKRKAEIREKKTLSYNISNELYNRNIKQNEWEKAKPYERRDMIHTAFNIMVDKMQLNLPEKLRDHILTIKDAASDSCGIFVRREADGSFVLDTEAVPTIEIDSDLLYKDNIQEVLNDLARKTTIMMEQVCCTEAANTFSDMKLKTAWNSEIVDRIGKTAAEEGEMERYAREFENSFSDICRKVHGFRNTQICFK